MKHQEKWRYNTKTNDNSQKHGDINVTTLKGVFLPNITNFQVKHKPKTCFQE